MDNGGRYPFNASGPTSARGRIAGMLDVTGAQDVPMSDQAASQVAGTSADAELEELCSALPGWHQQHIAQAPVILGGLSRTVSAPSSFLLTASRLSPCFQTNGGGVNILSTAQQKEENSCDPSPLDNDGRGHAQPPAIARWLQQQQEQQQQPSTVNSAPLNTQYLSPQIGAGSSGMSLGSNTVPSERKPWGGPGAPGASWSTLLPPGEQHTSAMLLSLYPEQMGCNETSGSEPVSFPPSQGSSRLKHTGVASRQPSQQPGAQAPGSGLSDWPSGGRLLDGSSGMQIVCGRSPSGPQSGPFFPAIVLQSSASGEQVTLSAAAAAALSGPGSLASGAGVLHMQVNTLQLSSGSPDVPQPQHLIRMGRCGKVDVPVREVRHPTSGDEMEAAEQEGQAEAETRTALDMDQDGTAQTHQSASSGSSMCPAANGVLNVAGARCEATGHSDGGARPGGQSGTFVQAVEKVEPCPVAAVGPSVGGNMGIADVKATAPLGVSASVTGPGEVSTILAATGAASIQGCASGLAVRGSSGGGAGSIRAGKTCAPASGSHSNSGNGPLVPETAPSEEGLQLLALRFRNRPGRVPKAVAKLGPIAELAKNAAAGKIKLEKDELDDLIMTVETSLAKAVTEQKEDSRARNRVAQQRFRNRQRETIAALQAKVEEQEALIAALQQKIQLYEAKQQHQQQQPKPGRSVKRSGSE